VTIAEEQSSTHRVGLDLLGNQDGERLLSRLGDLEYGLGFILGLRIGKFGEPRNASFG
jgi:hypothetical protein